MILYILFHWSGTPVCSQLVFCMHFCVWRCIPDVSEERDVLHVHLLLCHLVLPWSAFWWVLHSFINLLNKTLSNTFNKTVFYQHIKQTRMKWKEEVSWGDSLVEGEDGEWNHKSLAVRNGSMPFGKWLPSASCISESWDAEALTNLPATLILICTGNSLAT